MLSLKESQAIPEIANFLYGYLPGTPHPYADKAVSFASAAQEAGVPEFWRGGSKLPALTALLEQTLDMRRGSFCVLITAIVRKSIAYRKKKGNPITREEIRELNNLITKVSFKVPELWDPAFLDALPLSDQKIQKPEGPVDAKKLTDDLLSLNRLTPGERGFAFEKFLNNFFGAFGLEPRGSFRLVGEQIDGSFELDHEIYLLEGKWQNELTGQADLLVLREKVESKAAWSRGVFISYSGFSTQGLEAFARGRATNLIGLTGEDIYFILDEKLSLVEILRKKMRLAAETGRFFMSAREVSLWGIK